MLLFKLALGLKILNITPKWAVKNGLLSLRQGECVLCFFLNKLNKIIFHLTRSKTIFF